VATLRLVLQVEIDGGALQIERIAPNAIDITVGGRHLRQTVTLANGAYTALHVGEITPRRWFLFNAGTADIVVSCGTSDDIVLAAGEPALVPSTQQLMAKGSGGTATLMYAVMEA